MLYLAEKFKTPDFWYPADLRQRARVNEYLSWQHTAIRMHGSKIFWLRVRSPSLICVGAVRLVMSYQHHVLAVLEYPFVWLGSKITVQ